MLMSMSQAFIREKKILGMARCRKVMNAQSQLHDEAAFKHCIIAICFRNGFYERGHFYLLSPFFALLYSFVCANEI